MDLLKRDELDSKRMLGRTIARAMGDNAAVSDEISCGYARFSLADGMMIPHKHEREIIYVIDAKGCSTRFGTEKERMDQSFKLEAGDLLRYHEGEWHIFDMEDEESYLDIFWLFSCPQNHTVE